MLNYTIAPGLRPLAVDFQLDSYIVHRKVQHCTNCGNSYHSSQVFEVFVNPRLTGLTAAHQLKPAKTLQAGYKIGISTLRTEETPCCHECFTNLHSSAMPTPEMKPLDPAEWAKTLKRKYAPAPAASPERREAPARERPFPFKPTIADL
jgi:hypothetical protein